MVEAMSLESRWIHLLTSVSQNVIVMTFKTYV